MREGLQAGVDGRSKALGREEDRGFQLSASAPLTAQSKMLLRDSTQITPEMHSLGRAGESTLHARKRREKKLFQGAASSTHGA